MHVGPLEWEPCANFIKRRFQSLAGEREIYCHFTVATDTDNIKPVWQDIRGVIIKKAMNVF